MTTSTPGPLQAWAIKHFADADFQRWCVAQARSLRLDGMAGKHTPAQYAEVFVLRVVGASSLADLDADAEIGKALRGLIRTPFNAWARMQARLRGEAGK